MLTHHQSPPSPPRRAVVIGSGGFVGNATIKKLTDAQVPVLGLTRANIDLLAGDASVKLSTLLRLDDAVVVVSAKAPAKTGAMVTENLHMIESVCEALTTTPVAQVVYISSDAVYADSDSPLTESSCAQPGSLHGIMHLAREVMLAQAYKGPLCILRPTLIYGAADPHNGYGPNSFRRLVASGKDIVLFGEGEERRDHVFIDDVAEAITRAILHRSAGVLNIATGTVTSFRKIAELVSALMSNRVNIKSSPRQGPMPHNGYRAFDVTNLLNSFPGYGLMPLEKGLELVQQQTMQSV